MKRWIGKSVLSCLTAVALSAAGATAAMADVVKVGLIASYSGPFAIWGQQFKRGVEAYQKVHGKSVNGHEIQVIYRDVGSVDPAKARQLAEELILREKIQVLTGFSLTPNALAVAEIITEAQMPTVIFNAATSIITRKSPFYIRLSMTIQQYVWPAGEWAAKQGGFKEAYVMVSDYAPGHDAEEAFVKAFEGNGGKIVGKDRIPLSVTDFAPYMERAERSGAKLVYIFMPAGAPSIAIVREFAKRGLKAKGVQLMGGGEAQEIALPAIGDDVVGTITGLHYTETNKNPANIALRKALEEMYGKDGVPDIGLIAAWDGMDLIYQAVAKLGPKFTGPQFMEFAKTVKLDSPRGPVQIDPVERDIVQNIYMRKVEKVDGKLVNIDFFTAPMVKDPWKINNPNAK